MAAGDGLAGMPSMGKKPPGFEKYSHEELMAFA